MRRIAAIAAVTMAAACMPMEEPVAAGEDARYACDASKVQGLIGRTASQAIAAEAVRAAGARTMRWITPGSAYTMDFRQDRLNIHLNERNVITKVDCG